VSNDIFVYFQARRLPSADAWNHALAHLGWDVRFTPELDVKNATGFQRGLFCGRRTGAEMYFNDVSAGQASDLGPVGAKADRQVTFSFAYELEAAFVFAASCALCALAQGVCLDPQAGKILPASVLQQQVNSMIARSRQLAGPEW
jgi:hypothetical protein